MERFAKALKKAKDVPENAAKAKMEVLKNLKKDAMDMMGDKLKKVTIASDSPEGIKKGLETAKKLIKGDGMLGEESAMHGSESDTEEVEEMPADEVEGMEEESEGEETSESEMEELLAEIDTEEEINDLIQMLMKKKQELGKSEY